MPRFATTVWKREMNSSGLMGCLKETLEQYAKTLVFIIWLVVQGVGF